MKNFYIIILLSLFQFTNAQTNDYSSRMQQVFGNIDQAKVTSGFLKDYGLRFADIEKSDGILTTLNYVNESEWQASYNSLYSMRVGNNSGTMDSPATVTSNLKSTQENSNEVLIAVQHYNYQQYKSNAYTNGDVTITNERIYDVTGCNHYNIAFAKANYLHKS